MIKVLSLFPYAGHLLTSCHKLPELDYALGRGCSLFQVIDNDPAGLLKQFKEKMEHSVADVFVPIATFGENVANGMVRRWET
jgi:hypothetical protein